MRAHGRLTWSTALKLSRAAIHFGCFQLAGEAVMMGWETPLMERHAAIICASGGDVLNVGFGMGIIDGFIQTHKVR